MKNKPQTLKGFRDFLPNDVKSRLWLIGKMRQSFEKFGFEPIETPALEYQSLLLGKYGDQADKLVYKFQDEGDRKVALRYDQTVPTARVIAQNIQDLPTLQRRYQIQSVWRAEKPQKGRYREFLQCDADIFGFPAPLADAEILALFYETYANIGLTDLQIKINSRDLLLKTLKQCNIPKDKINKTTSTLDDMDKIGISGVQDKLQKAGISPDQISLLFEKLKVSTPDNNLQQIIDSAIVLGIPKDKIIFAPSLARGLDYYTGMTFEGTIPGYSSGSVGGGGRYDNLVNELTGTPIPAVGFGIGFDRTLEAAIKYDLAPTFGCSTSVLVTIFSEDLLDKSILATSTLRRKGIATELYPNQDAKLDKQLKYADKKGVPYVVIIGPEEAERTQVTLKNLQNKTQKTLLLTEVPSAIK